MAKFHFLDKLTKDVPNGLKIKRNVSSDKDISLVVQGERNYYLKHGKSDWYFKVGKDPILDKAFRDRDWAMFELYDKK